MWTISVCSNLKVVGRNGEASDLSNPRGEIIGEVVNLLAQNRDGRRYLGPVLGEVDGNHPLESYQPIADEFQKNMKAYWHPGRDTNWVSASHYFGSVAFHRDPYEQVNIDRQEIARAMRQAERENQNVVPEATVWDGIDVSTVRNVLSRHLDFSTLDGLDLGNSVDPDDSSGEHPGDDPEWLAEVEPEQVFFEADDDDNDDNDDEPPRNYDEPAEWEDPSEPNW